MSTSFNKVILIGNLTADPEIRTTPTGVSVCNFTIAVNRQYAKQGEKSSDFISICAWRASAEYVGKYARKGNQLLVCGSIQTRDYTNNQGQKVYLTEVVADEVKFVGNNKNDGASKGVSTANSYIPTSFGGNSSGFEELGDNGNLPF